ncbi:hypothetical protein Hanom_Chr12g01101611 [Helianthus anomalus]
MTRRGDREERERKNGGAGAAPPLPAAAVLVRRVSDSYGSAFSQLSYGTFHRSDDGGGVCIGVDGSDGDRRRFGPVRSNSQQLSYESNPAGSGCFGLSHFTVSGAGQLSFGLVDSVKPSQLSQHGQTESTQLTRSTEIQFESIGQPRFGCGSTGQILVRDNFGQLWSTPVNIRSTAVKSSQHVTR